MPQRDAASPIATGRMWPARIILCLLVLLASLAVAMPAAAQYEPCWDDPPSMDSGIPQWSEAPDMVIDPSLTYRATIETNHGTIVVELLAREAPVTVNNFICLAQAGYYDATIFHRVIDGFMIQGGDPTGTGRGGPGYEFDDELPTGDAPYTRGTVAMANAGPDTNGSQFFIAQEDQPASFPPDYAIFGQVTKGMDVVDTIASVPVEESPGGEMSSPVSPVWIAAITVRGPADRPPPGNPDRNSSAPTTSSLALRSLRPRAPLVERTTEVDRATFGFG
jgi:peptidylprolyl isomerase